MIAFQDFVPHRQRRYLGMVNEYEDLQEVVTRANRWIEQKRVHVLNVETVLVTELPDAKQEKGIGVKMASESMTMSRYQIVRIWYHQKEQQAHTGQTTRLQPVVEDADYRDTDL